MREKDPNKQALIYKAALKLVMQEGLTALKMGILAKECGIAAGTIYLYFEDKEDLVHRLYQHLQDNNAKQLLEGYKPEQSFSENFQALWFNLLDLALSSPEVTAFLKQYERSPYSTSIEKTTQEPIHPALFELLDSGKKEGVVANIDTTLLVAQLSGGISELAYWHESGLIKLNPDARRQAFALAWKMIRP